MKCGRPWPLWAPTAEGVFLSPRRSQGRGGRGVARGGAVATVDGFGARVRRFGWLHRSRGARCAELTPAACSVGLTVRRFGAGGCAVSGDFIGRGVRGARNLRRLLARWRSRCGGFGAGGRRFGRLHRSLWGEVRGTCAGGLRGGVHGAAASGREDAVSGDFIGRCGARCAGLAPTACAAGLTVDGFGA